jgi:diadenosine tetraphosphatase ApaH/serine/threonine PP2A family protein phosphatase
MRRCYSTITPSLVRSTAHAALQSALPWKRYGQRVSVTRLLDLLLLVAALRSSLYAIVRRFRFGFSHETARQALRANLPDSARLQQGLLDALYAFGARTLRRRRWDIAIDLHYCPFYGDRHTPGIIGGPRKQGSKHHYAYATAALLHRRHRYTVGLLVVDQKYKPHEVVQTLLTQLHQRGLRLRGVALDSGFDSGDTVLLLQERGLSYVVPLRRKGRGSNRRNVCFALPVGTVTDLEWVTDQSRRPVRTAVVVVPRRGEPRSGVYAFDGWGATKALGRARQARRAYRRRFGIETSYRQMNEGKARTTKKDVVYRLLLVGLGLLLRQVWVWLTWQLARAWRCRPKQWLGALPLARLLDWLKDEVRRRYKEERSIDVRPLLEQIIATAAA